MIVLYRESKEN